jgi:hypothetical protein
MTPRVQQKMWDTFRHRGRILGIAAARRAASDVNNEQNLSNHLYFHQYRGIYRTSYLFSSTSPDAPKLKIPRPLFSTISRVIPANLFHAVWFPTEKG